MERTKMDRPGWWFETDCHMEFEPEDPQAFGWEARRMKGFVNKCNGRWNAYEVTSDGYHRIANVAELAQAMESVESRCAQGDLFLANAEGQPRREAT